MQSTVALPPPSWFVRPAEAADLDGLLALAMTADAGMTNLPRERKAMAARLERSRASFAADMPKPADELYILVLDDGSGQVIGTSCVVSRVGRAWPFYSFQRTRVVHDSRQLERRFCEDLLQLNNQLGGVSEVGGLFLHPARRQPGAGRLLARSRYLLIGMAPHRFQDCVIAELRGWVDETGQVPFWDAVGSRFFHMTLGEADHYNAVHGNQFIADLMPKYPLYVSMLPTEAREAIGRVHRGSAPALSLLEQEGFAPNDHVDIFDAGPIVACPVSSLRAVREACSGTLAKGHGQPVAAPTLIAAGPFDRFRCWATSAVIEDDVAAPIVGHTSPGETVIHAPF